MKIVVINGPNINLLGLREPSIYGLDTYETLCKRVLDVAKEYSLEVEIYQSNHEGDLVDKIQECLHGVDGIVINPGAYTHTSIALLDALLAVGVPAVEVHLSDLAKREDFRQISFLRSACIATITGRGIQGYIDAIQLLLSESHL